MDNDIEKLNELLDEKEDISDLCDSISDISNDLNDDVINLNMKSQHAKIKEIQDEISSAIRSNLIRCIGQTTNVNYSDGVLHLEGTITPVQPLENITVDITISEE